MKPARVLTIAGSDSCGGAGIQADLKTIAALGALGMSVITAVTAQNTLGIQGIREIPPEFVQRQFESVITDIGADAAKTGMLANTKILKVVAGMVRKYRIKKLVVDPVMAAKRGEALIKGDVREALIRELIPLALVVVPNIPEAEILADMKIATVNEMKKAADIIYKFGGKNVVVKGGHLVGDAVDVLYDGKEYFTFSSKRIYRKEAHGTGCTFSAAITTLLAKGKSVFEAVEGAKVYITGAIRVAYKVGAGYSLIDHLAPVLYDK